KSFRSAAALLGIPRVSPKARECYTESAGRARYLRGDADRGREVAVLPASGRDFGEDGGGGFSADRVDAGPGGATGANGHSGGGDQQLSEFVRAAAGDGASDTGGISAALSFAGAAGRRKYFRLAGERSGGLLCGGSGARHFRGGTRVSARLRAA